MLSPTALSFAELLSPVLPQDFWQHSFSQQPLHIPAQGNKAQFLQALMPFKALTHLLHFRSGYAFDLIHQLQKYTFTPPLNTRASQEQVQFLLQQGASLVLESVDKQSESLGMLCDQLSGELECRTAFNLYLSYPQKAAFPLHYDTHDLFVLHLQGAKTWELYGETTPYPIENGRPNEKKPEKSLQRVLLQAGDVLYIPKGHWHKAEAEPHSNPSLHLTLGLYGPTGLDLLDYLKETLASNPEFRAPLSPLPWKAEAQPQSVNALAKQLQDFLASPWQADFETYLRHKTQRRTGFQLPQAYWKHPEEIPDTAQFRRYLTAYTLTHKAGQLELRYDNKHLIFAPAAEPLLRYLLETPQFNRGDLMAAFPDYPWSTIRAVLLPLLQDGVCILKNETEKRNSE
jgi:ribosomal protein L16 Arg81 hydroxylase